MKVLRTIYNIGLISLQHKKETGKEFNLNDLISWLGDRKLIEIDNDIIEKQSKKLI